MADNDDAQATPRGLAALGLGERLRSARKARALSVTQVAEALHLEEPMVLALEEERFDAMGAPVFVRGHLRRYAQLVGLAPDAVLEAYRAAVPDSVAPPSLARPRAEPEAVRIGNWVYWLLGAVLLIGIIIALGSGREQPAPGTPLPVESAAPVTPEEPAPAQPAPDAATPATGEGAAPAPVPAEPGAPAPAGT
jgi:cytoskeleton protein RodZ